MGEVIRDQEPRRVLRPAAADKRVSPCRLELGGARWKPSFTLLDCECTDHSTIRVHGTPNLAGDRDPA
jgi:hypothetical protein